MGKNFGTSALAGRFIRVTLSSSSKSDHVFPRAQMVKGGLLKRSPGEAQERPREAQERGGERVEGNGGGREGKEGGREGGHGR